MNINIFRNCSNITLSHVGPFWPTSPPHIRYNHLVTPLLPKWFGNIWMTFDINLNKYRISLIPAAYQCTIMCGLLIEIIFFRIVFGYQWTHSYDNYLLCLDCSGTITNLLFFLLCNWLYYTTCLPVHYKDCLLFTFITVTILFVIIRGVAI